jgi:hypothetical protein
MKIINKSIKDGHTVLGEKDLKKLFGSLMMRELGDVLGEVGCDVRGSGRNINVTLTRAYDELEIQVEERIEEFENF